MSDDEVFFVVVVMSLIMCGFDVWCWKVWLFCLLYYMVFVVVMVGGGNMLWFGEILLVY